MGGGGTGAPAEGDKKGDEGLGGSKVEELDAVSRRLPPQPLGLMAKGSPIDYSDTLLDCGIADWSPMSKLIRIANGQGFWGDSIDAPVRLVEAGGIDYLTLDYLAEVTLSIMQKQRRKDTRLGYATDFVDLMERVLPQLKAKGIRVVANAGGVNPEACRAAVLEVAKKLGITGLRIATVTGDDVQAAYLRHAAQLLGKDGAPLEYAKLDPNIQQALQNEALEFARERRLKELTDALELRLKPVVYKERLKRIPWPVPPAGPGK